MELVSVSLFHVRVCVLGTSWEVSKRHIFEMRRRTPRTPSSSEIERPKQSKQNEARKVLLFCVVSFVFGLLVMYFGRSLLEEQQIQPPKHVEVPSTSRPTRNAKADRPNRNVWRWAEDELCLEPPEFSLPPMTSSSPNRRWNTTMLTQVAKAFRRCGVLLLHNVVSPESVERFSQGLNERFDPLLASRSRVRNIIKGSRRDRQTLNRLWQEKLQDEELFNAGDTYRERNDGRIDMELPFESPFNDPEIIYNPFVHPLLLRLLGEDYKLKGINSVIALNVSNGNADQHWHRDTELLFPEDSTFRGEYVHDKYHGIHMPSYAINVFVPLVPLTEENGPTQFSLGSHQWGLVWADDEKDGVIDYRFTGPVGSVILFDYRTVHRGTANLGEAARPVAMLIYGRSWWVDVINYGQTNYGGKSAPVRSYDSVVALMPSLEKTAAQKALEKQRLFEHYLQLWSRSV